MTKYEPLQEYLKSRSSSEVPMSFAEIEKIIGGRLPASALKHRAWWSNNSTNSVMTKAWLDAGYKSERVDLAAQRLTFRRAGKSKAVGDDEGRGQRVLERIWANLGGTVRFAKDVDLTEPTGEVWDAEVR